MLGTLDKITCSVCGSMDGSIINLTDESGAKLKGVTLPPFHPNCRCSTAPYFDDMESTERIARGEDGKTFYVSDDMSFEEWKEKFVKNTKSNDNLIELNDGYGWKKYSKNAYLFERNDTDSINPIPPYRKTPVPEPIQNEIDFLQDAGFIIEGFDTYEISPKIMEETRKSLMHLRDNFPTETQNLHVVYNFNVDKSVFGWFDPENKTINFNSNIFSNESELKEAYNIEVRTSNFPKGTDYRAIIYHEFGHLYCDYHNISEFKILKNYMNNPEEKVWFSAKKARELLTLHLSYNSIKLTKNHPQYEEMLADCFAEYYNSNEPRELCKALLKEAKVI